MASAAVAGSTYTPQQINQMQRQAVVRQSVQMTQQITSQTIAPQSNPLLNVQPRPVGLIKRFIVSIVATLSNTGTVPVNLVDMGLANVLSNVTYTDLNNYQRISTSGLHLTLLASAKRKRPYGGVYSTAANGNLLSQALNIPGVEWGIFSAPQTIAAGATGTLRTVYEVPLAYSDDDLRGAIYANVINATQNLGLTINQTPVVAAADSSFAVYAGAAGAAGSFTSVTVTVYQEYLDQLPSSNGQTILPTLDLSTVYELKNTTLSAITVNQDFYIPFSNMRDFVSTFVIFNNNGGAAGRTFGTDTNYWALRSANMTDLWKVDPLLAAQRSRAELTFDLPAGVQYFPFRRQPISTNTYGNMQLVLNANTISGSPYVTALWEDFGLLNTLAGATSLASN